MNEQIKQKKVLETINICSNEESRNATSQKTEMVKLVGITTSQIQQALKTNNPYPARVFLKLGEECIGCHNAQQLCQALWTKHSNCIECAEAKCQECEMPVFFRIKENDHWIKPQVPKYSYLSVKGKWTEAIKSQRKSFTAYSYQLITPLRKEVFNYYE